MEDNDDWFDNMKYMDDYDEDEVIKRKHYNQLFDIILNKLENWETNLIIYEMFSDINKQKDRAKELKLSPETYRVYLSQIKKKIKKLC